MQIRPYLTFKGNASEAIELYKKAWDTNTIEILKFNQMPPKPEFEIPKGYEDKVLQATLKMGDNFIRISDCGPGHTLNDSTTELIAITVEDTEKEVIQKAFDTLAEEGKIGIPLQTTFYSSLSGVVFDKYGVMWILSAR